MTCNLKSCPAKVIPMKAIPLKVIPTKAIPTKSIVYFFHQNPVQQKDSKKKVFQQIPFQQRDSNKRFSSKFLSNKRHSIEICFPQKPTILLQFNFNFEQNHTAHTVLHRWLHGCHSNLDPRIHQGKWALTKTLKAETNKKRCVQLLYKSICTIIL